MHRLLNFERVSLSLVDRLESSELRSRTICVGKFRISARVRTFAPSPYGCDDPSQSVTTPSTIVYTNPRGSDWLVRGGREYPSMDGSRLVLNVASLVIEPCRRSILMTCALVVGSCSGRAMRNMIKQLARMVPLNGSSPGSLLVLVN